MAKAFVKITNKDIYTEIQEMKDMLVSSCNETKDNSRQIKAIWTVVGGIALTIVTLYFTKLHG